MGITENQFNLHFENVDYYENKTVRIDPDIRRSLK